MTDNEKILLDKLVEVSKELGELKNENKTLREEICNIKNSLGLKERKIRLFKYVDHGKLELILEEKTSINKELNWCHYNENEIEYFLRKEIKRKGITVDEDFKCILMIDNEVVMRVFEWSKDIVFDCVEIDIMYFFVLWYRKEYNDYEFNGSKEITDNYGMLENIDLNDRSIDMWDYIKYKDEE
jgi:hypothetical protein